MTPGQASSGALFETRQFQDFDLIEIIESSIVEHLHHETHVSPRSQASVSATYC
jgi:hypothetical protein